MELLILKGNLFSNPKLVVGKLVPSLLVCHFLLLSHVCSFLFVQFFFFVEIMNAVKNGFLTME
jgi:hypothetical protein